MQKSRRARAWRSFDPRARAAIDAQLKSGVSPHCPRCGGCLEAQPSTRFASVLPTGARGFDLDCRGCRRFFSRVRLSERSLYHLRIRRLARAVLRA